MTVGSDSITVKHELGARLKAARVAAGHTTVTAAPLIGTSQPSVSRMERGLQRVSGIHLEAMAVVYQVTGDELATWRRLLGDLRRTDRWWHDPPYRKWLPGSQYAALIEVEDSAASLCSIQLQVVPGLLQTPDYTRALMRHSAVPMDPERIDAMVQIRQVRSRRLLDPSPPLRAAFVICEAVLDLRYATAAVHTAQMRRLAEFARLPNIRIGVIPYSRMIDLDSVEMYKLPNGNYVVYTDSLIAGPRIENRFPREDVEQIKAIMVKAQRRALSPGSSIAAIEQRMV